MRLLVMPRSLTILSITAAELNEAIQKREVDLAAMKKRQDEYKASKNRITPAAPAQGGFNF